MAIYIYEVWSGNRKPQPAIGLCHLLILLFKTPKLWFGEGFMLQSLIFDTISSKNWRELLLFRVPRAHSTPAAVRVVGYLQSSVYLIGEPW